ncbi:hypothetical protein NOVOSPHI9U_640001 [Novosphingobium sp. 9U]|nr:hypothetical protein NOVOSPHI9U_640001 [Novosphingobium sp. 9U]
MVRTAHVCLRSACNKPNKTNFELGLLNAYSFEYDAFCSAGWLGGCSCADHSDRNISTF